MNSLVSIIVPVYNIASYLDRLMNSLLKQTYNKIEIIIVDDGSSDESLNKCLEYRKSDKRVHVVSQKNSGVSVARNRGISEAQGNFLFFIDGDDYIEKNMVERMLSEMSFDIDMVICGITIHDQYLRQNQRFKGIATEQLILTMKDLAYNYWDYYELGIINAPWNKLYRKEIIEKYELKFPVGIKMGEDAYFNLSYFMNSSKVKIIKDPLYHYFIYKGQSSKKVNTDHYEMMSFNFKQIHLFINEFNGFQNEQNFREDAYQFYRETLYSIKLIYRSSRYTTREQKKYVNRVINNDSIKIARPKTLEDRLLLPLFRKKSVQLIHYYIQVTEQIKMGIKKVVLK